MSEKRYELHPFFGNDGRADLFIKIFLQNNDFYGSINDLNPKDIENNSDAISIMMSGNYSKGYKPANMEDNDIHYDFTDFLIQTGLFHKKMENKSNNYKSNEESQKIWDLVYNKWSELSDFSKRFYNKTLSFLKKVNNDWVKMDFINDKYDIQNKDSFRININKASGIPIFSKMIPKYVPTLFNNIWYTKRDLTNDTIKLDLFKERNIEEILKTIYEVSFSGGVVDFMENFPNEWIGEARAMQQIFHVNIDRIIANRLFRRKKLNEIPKQNDDSCFSLLDKNVWKVDEEGKLYLLDKQGNKIYYEKDSPETLRILKANFKCYSSGLKLNEESCDRYMINCLLSNYADLKECIDVWKNKDVFKVSKEEINNIHPQVALATLKKFGFREYETYDPIAGMKINKIETIDSWTNNQLKKKFADVADIILGNDILLNYLRLLTEYVNSNPKILNRNRELSLTKELIGEIDDPTLANMLNIQMRYEPTSNQYQQINDLVKLKSYISNSNIGYLYNPQSLTTQYLSQPFVNPVIGYAYQYGGQEKITGSDILKAMLVETINSLTTMNKIIDKNDLNKIEKKLENLKCIESQLIKIATYLQEYAYVSDLLGNNTPEVINEDKIQKYIEEHKILFLKQDSEINLILKESIMIKVVS